MTSYGRSVKNFSFGDLVIEVHSVNKKGLDFYIALPKDLLFLDVAIRKWVSASFKRGQVTVKVQFRSRGGMEDIEFYTPAMKSLKKQIEKICLDLECTGEGVTFPFLYEQVKDSFLSLPLEEDLIRENLHLGIKEALEICLQMKKTEGAVLAATFQEHLSATQNLLSQIQKKIVSLKERYEQKLLTKLRELKEVTQEDRERLIREVFFYLERVDVEEEIVRMHSHLEQFLQLIAGSEESVGKTMDFLLQEMVREMNTLASKSEDADLSHLSLQIRGEIEKMREQAQNIE